VVAGCSYSVPKWRLSVGNTHLLLNIDVGTLLQIAQQKKRQNHGKNIGKKIYFQPTDPNFFTI
jgi:hypothetical protein